jgi:hypothetical protein
MNTVATMPGDRGPVGTTAKLHRLLGKFPDGAITLGAIIDDLGAAGTGLSLLLFSLTALIPGIAPVFGVALCAVAIGMMLGRSEPLLPERLRRWRMDREQVHSGLQRLAPRIAWLERWLRPRETHLLSGVGIRLAGLASLVNGVLIVLPIPFGNTAPAVAMVILSLGIAAGDGVAVALGLLATVIALAVDTGMIVLGYAAFATMTDYLF